MPTTAFSMLNRKAIAPPAQAASTSVARAIDVLEVVSRSAEGQTASEAARELGLPKSSVWTILRTLESKRAVARDPATQRYTLGDRLVELGMRAGRHPALRRVARPYLVQLGEDAGELAYLAVVDEEHVLYLDKVESRQPIRYIAEIGTRRPLHCTATGKLYLSFLPDAEALERARRSSLLPFTPSTITEPARLRRELATIRTRGYAVSREELLEGVMGIAAPIVGPPDRMRGALVVAALTRGAADREERFAKMVVRLARQVSRALAHERDGRRHG